MSAAVALTGLGSLNVAGPGLESAARAFAGPAPPPVELDRSAGYHRGERARMALLTTGFEPRRWLAPNAMRRMSLPSKLAVSASKMAVEDAGLEPESLAGPATGVVVSTSFGPCEFTERLLKQVYGSGPESASPFLFTESVANAAAAQIALALGARGANSTVTQREAGWLIGLETAARELLLGRAERLLTGTVEEMTPLLHAVLDRFGALSRCREDGVEVARPFDRRRTGYLGADGAVMALVESEESARRRGARVHALVRPLGSAFDPQAPPTGWSRDPRTLARALERLLERAGIDPGTIDRVVSCASGARGADRLEGLVLRRVWGDRPLPPVLAPKAWLGEHGGALVLAAVLSLAGASFAATPGFAEPDPEIGVVPHDGAELGPARRVLVSALAAGGAAAWALFERPGA